MILYLNNAPLLCFTTVTNNQPYLFPLPSHSLSLSPSLSLSVSGPQIPGGYHTLTLGSTSTSHLGNSAHLGGSTSNLYGSSSTLLRKKAPAPPPPTVAPPVKNHVRNPSDPGLVVPHRGHVRSPSEPPPLPAKTMQGRPRHNLEGGEGSGTSSKLQNLCWVTM